MLMLPVFACPAPSSSRPDTAWGLVSKRGVLAVVEDFDVLEALCLHLTVAGKACAVNAFVLESAIAWKNTAQD